MLMIWVRFIYECISKQYLWITKNLSPPSSAAGTPPRVIFTNLLLVMPTASVFDEPFLRVDRLFPFAGLDFDIAAIRKQFS